MARYLKIVKQPQKLPVVLTTEEVLLLLESAPGPKYKRPRLVWPTVLDCAFPRLPT